MRDLRRTLALLMVVCAAAGLTSCSGLGPIGTDARSALLEHWESLPSAPGVEHRITRAWRGGVAALDPGSPVAAREVWCVEAEISSPNDPSVDGALEMWIVTRDRTETRWSAYLLAAMSSTWPYEACAESG